MKPKLTQTDTFYSIRCPLCPYHNVGNWWQHMVQDYTDHFLKEHTIINKKIYETLSSKNPGRDSRNRKKKPKANNHI